jgi:hypothetical protein
MVEWWSVAKCGELWRDVLEGGEVRQGVLGCDEVCCSWTLGLVGPRSSGP